MDKEESSGEKMEGLPKQEVSGIHGDRCTPAAALPAVLPHAADLAQLCQGARVNQCCPWPCPVQALLC